MSLHVAIALCWLAALHRVYVAARSPRLWRVAFAVAVTALAVALTAVTYRAWMVQLAPHLEVVVARCSAVAAACAGLVYIHTLRHEQSSRRHLAQTVAGGLAVCTALVVTWSMAPLHLTGDVFGEVNTDPAVAVHNLLFFLYVGYGAGAAAAYCAHRLLPRRREDAARVPSLAMIGAGTAVGGFACLLGAASVVVADPLATQLRAAKYALTPVTMGTLAVGVLLLAAVSPTFVEVAALHRRWRRLRSLWKGLTARHPDVALNVRPSWPLREALRMREQRALVEIHDALARERVPADVVTLQALGRTLRRGERGPLPAAKVLPPSGDFTTDLETVLRLAAAYDAAPR